MDRAVIYSLVLILSAIVLSLPEPNTVERNCIAPIIKTVFVQPYYVSGDIINSDIYLERGLNDEIPAVYICGGQRVKIEGVNVFQFPIYLQTGSNIFGEGEVKPFRIFKGEDKTEKKIGGR